MCITNLSEVTLAVPVEIRLCEKKTTQSSHFQTSRKYALERETLDINSFIFIFTISFVKVVILFSV